ncbi:MAG: tRNA (adenosine(37)-N6)-threonylcarbamoyltransferase complex dimerization subunit type 1 TsaB [Clostridia bacterium]|nr:tRNA (adenosine(37)-N6)-threonylcarbamoyltransferase complex dimerization subunit type 1 TsaB [Clostridia bacterium]
MKILGIDTTTKSASCSVLNEDKYYTKAISNEITHSEKLLPIIHETLEESNLKIKDIELLLAINGPGSFTGIRIGLATVKALAQVRDLDIYSISSIDLISYVALKKLEKKEAYVLSLIDAKNNRVYYGINKVLVTENNKMVIEKVMDVSNDILTDALDNISDIVKDKDLIIAGDCVEQFKEQLEVYSSNLLNFYPTTNDLIDSYLNIENTKDYMYNAYSLDALYARPSQAERMAKNG